VINFALVFFVSFELCYYLLLIQTGIVEYFHSELCLIFSLPIGGMVGSVLVTYISFDKLKLLKILVFLQILLTLFYPDINLLLLFILGLVVGSVAVLIIDFLKYANKIDLVTILSISYLTGTSLFNYDFNSRQIVGIVFSIVVFVSVFFIQQTKKIEYLKYDYSIFMMFLWVLLDSTLFETLSRYSELSIWRNGYELQIIFGHILGVIFAMVFNLTQNQKALVVFLLFGLSFFLFFQKEALLLSFVYPFVISFYNLLIFLSLRSKEDIKTIGISMLFIGWIASGMGLIFALMQVLRINFLFVI
jgi:hypothetical protein